MTCPSLEEQKQNQFLKLTPTLIKSVVQTTSVQVAQTARKQCQSPKEFVLSNATIATCTKKSKLSPILKPPSPEKVPILSWASTTKLWSFCRKSWDKGSRSWRMARKKASCGSWWCLRTLRTLGKALLDGASSHSTCSCLLSLSFKTSDYEFNQIAKSKISKFRLKTSPH